jgi:hypothetical protein
MRFAAPSLRDPDWTNSGMDRATDVAKILAGTSQPREIPKLEFATTMDFPRFLGAWM